MIAYTVFKKIIQPARNRNFMQRKYGGCNLCGTSAPSLPFAEMPGKDNSSRAGSAQIDAARTTNAKEDKIPLCAVPAT